MSETKTLVCITCPRGCTLQVTTEDDGTISVTGNSCKRGEIFGKQEMTHPMRTICSTVATTFPESPVVPCRVSAEIPKDKIFTVMDEINRACVTTRIGRGDVIIPNVSGLGVDVICTSDVLKSGEENNNGIQTV